MQGSESSNWDCCYSDQRGFFVLFSSRVLSTFMPPLNGSNWN